MLLLILSYAFLASIVVFLSIKLANYVDLIDKKTNLSGAFIGGVILAAVTSLPELFTSVSAVTIIDEANLVLGNIMGSNIFNMAVLGFLMVFFSKRFSRSTIGKSHYITTIFTVVLFILMILALFFKNIEQTFFGISMYSVIIVALYVFSIRFMAGDTAEDTSEDTSSLTLKQIVVRFIICTILLVTSSILITLVTDKLATELNLGATLAGALFLGVVTSLPELTSCVALARKNNFNACVGNIMGSGIFNFFILSIADILYRKGSVYMGESVEGTAISSTQYLAIFGLIASVIVAISLFIKNKINNKSVEAKEKAYPVLFILGLLLLVCYILFIAFSS